MSIDTGRIDGVSQPTAVNENDAFSGISVDNKSAIDINNLHAGKSLSAKAIGRRVVSASPDAVQSKGQN